MKYVYTSIFIVFCFICHHCAFAQGFSFELTGNPVDTTGWISSIDSRVNNDEFILTDARGDQSGYVYYSVPQALTTFCSEFTVSFDFRITNSSNPTADGIAFWYITNPPTGFTSGGNIGIPDNPNGLLFAMDTYNNDVASDNPLVTLRRMDGTSNYEEGSAAGRLTPDITNQSFIIDGQWHTCKITYASGAMTVAFDGNAPVMTGTTTLNITGYFGFSSGTGGSWATHSLRNVSIKGISNVRAYAVKDTVCSGESIYLRTDSIPNASYSWTGPDGFASNAINPVIDHAVVVNSGAYVLSTTGGSCPGKDTVNIVVYPTPSFSVRPTDTTICIGNQVQFLASTQSSQYVYNWSPGIYLNDSTIAAPVSDPADDVTYYLEVSDTNVFNMCTIRDTIQIDVLNNYFVIFNRDTVICKGSSVQINGWGNTGIQYMWKPTDGVSDVRAIAPLLTPDTSVTYSVTGSLAGCPDSIVSLTIEVQRLPAVDAGADIAACINDIIPIYASVASDYPAWYEWSPGGVLSNDTILNPILHVTEDMTLTLTATNELGCMGTDDVRITAHPNDFLRATPDTAICPEDTVQLHVTGDGLVSFHWQWNGYFTDTLNADPYVWPIASTVYTVYGINGFNCKDTASVEVVVYPKALLSLADSVRLYTEEAYQLNPAGNCMYFSWFPVVGLSATDIANPVARPDVNTRYFVLGVTENGCRAIDSIDVAVSFDSYIEVPNAFTPGNNVNGVLKLLQRGNPRLKNFSVFDRWGQRVFFTSDINEGWDGRLKGAVQPAGVYVYAVEAYTHNGRKIFKQGNITLLR